MQAVIQDTISLTLLQRGRCVLQQMMHKTGRAFIKNAERPIVHAKHPQFEN